MAATPDQTTDRDESDPTVAERAEAAADRAEAAAERAETAADHAPTASDPPERPELGVSDIDDGSMPYDVRERVRDEAASESDETT